MKRREVAPIVTLRPCHRFETRHTPNPHQQNHTLVTVRTREACQVLEGAHSTRNHLTLKKPICCILLLYKEEE
jgi:hypothetical protein